MLALMAPCAQPLAIVRGERPFVLMVVGVNGAGKTTTIGKLAHKLKSQGLSVMLAAGDTFRAAAVEQLQTWGQRNDIPVIAQAGGADAAAVAHDAMQAAAARKVDVLIIDTAGRLHTQSGLMDELKKIRRIVQRFDPQAPQEVLLVLDAGTGQNALAQLQHFHAAVEVTGLCLTKLDGTAKGGILFAMAQQAALPIRFIGVGEGIQDLREFDAEEFVEALLPENI
jgi:fused signal recognition particle receptor